MLAGIALFGVGACLGVAVLIPRFNWDFATKIGPQLEWARDHSDDEGGRNLGLEFASTLEQQREDNKRKLKPLPYLFVAQCLCLAAQVVVEAPGRAVA